MAITISVTNMKGGVGKTTLSVNVAYALAKMYDKRVLIVDVDPQFNATQYLLREQQYRQLRDHRDRYSTVVDILLAEQGFDFQYIATSLAHRPQQDGKKYCLFTCHKGTGLGQLDLLPSGMELIKYIDNRTSGSERKLKIFLERVENGYDYIFIDCPPTSTILSRAAYLASNYFLIPIKTDYFGIMGFPLLIEDIESFRFSYGQTIEPLGIVRTIYRPRGRLTRDAEPSLLKTAEKARIPVFQSTFRQYQEVANVVLRHRLLYDVASGSRSRTDIVAITNELVARLGGN